jgi:CBS domain-containing protein
MTIRDILKMKGHAVVTVTPTSSVKQAMAELVRHGIGAVVVYDDGIQGILTERDVLRAAAGDLFRLDSALVQDLMTRTVISASSEADIGEVMNLMTERRFRHLPVVDDGQLTGIISIGDVVNAMRQSVEAENRYLHAYIQGVPLRADPSRPGGRLDCCHYMRISSWAAAFSR